MIMHISAGVGARSSRAEAADRLAERLGANQSPRSSTGDARRMRPRNQSTVQVFQAGGVPEWVRLMLQACRRDSSMPYRLGDSMGSSAVWWQEGIRKRRAIPAGGTPAPPGRPPCDRIALGKDVIVTMMEES